jgi:glutathione-regulated potassium-efflux system ancillary protein KefG
VAHDVIALQFPFYWYSMPALLKEWLDLVWLHGFAYGKTGHALRGKRLFVATTTGGGQRALSPEGGNRFTMDEFLRPLEQTAYLCGMVWESPSSPTAPRSATTRRSPPAPWPTRRASPP